MKYIYIHKEINKLSSKEIYSSIMLVIHSGNKKQYHT